MHSSSLLLVVVNLLVASRPVIAASFGGLVSPNLPDKATCANNMTPACCYPPLGSEQEATDEGVPNCDFASTIAGCLDVPNGSGQTGTIYCCHLLMDGKGYGCKVQPVQPYKKLPQNPLPAPPPDIIKPVDAPGFDLPGTTPDLEIFEGPVFP